MRQGGRRSKPRTLVEGLIELLLDPGSSPSYTQRMLGSCARRARAPPGENGALSTQVVWPVTLKVRAFR
jgi:hypothetical protein